MFNSERIQGITTSAKSVENFFNFQSKTTTTTTTTTKTTNQTKQNCVSSARKTLITREHFNNQKARLQDVKITKGRKPRKLRDNPIRKKKKVLIIKILRDLKRKLHLEQRLSRRLQRLKSLLNQTTTYKTLKKKKSQCDSSP
ncbi:uncharacterized protein LOC127291294 [Leptopilina boulardi]|uniref:uncharacterized protein LOC127291294 n=1 Tax=Leptopilina boulardi TaxID=63433 RepID=UPI0021F63EB3|nr:uncharacterized protein LOC127291294 [Leptopilina boulardi]